MLSDGLWMWLLVCDRTDEAWYAGVGGMMDSPTGGCPIVLSPYSSACQRLPHTN